jgi:Protein of unknown function (DUF3035)
MTKHFSLLLSSVALAAISACGTTGNSARTPDEFRVVTKAPLSVPPEYKLRPPAAGTSLPAEVDPVRTETASAFGTTIGKGASASERALVAVAGANSVNPVVRNQVDYEETKTIRKPKSVADRVLFWRKDAEEPGAEPDTATGDAPIVIERTDATPRLKLPGT